MKQEWTPEQYLEIQDAELLKLCQEERIILPQISIDDISEDDIRDYSNKKEFLSYLLLAERLIINNIAYGGDEQQLVRCSTAVVRSFSGS